MRDRHGALSTDIDIYGHWDESWNGSLADIHRCFFTR